MEPQLKAKIKWHCRRGMLELDILLERFVDQHIDGLTPEQTHAFEALLSHPDPDVYAWLMGSANPMDKELFNIVNFIKSSDKA